MHDAIFVDILVIHLSVLSLGTNKNPERKRYNIKLEKCKIHSNNTLFICPFDCDFKKICKFVENARSGTVKCGFTVVLMFRRIIVPLSAGSSIEIKMSIH